jgi:hypothetical protein
VGKLIVLVVNLSGFTFSLSLELVLDLSGFTFFLVQELIVIKQKNGMQQSYSSQKKTMIHPS